MEGEKQQEFRIVGMPPKRRLIALLLSYNHTNCTPKLFQYTILSSFGCHIILRLFFYISSSNARHGHREAAKEYAGAAANHARRRKENQDGMIRKELRARGKLIGIIARFKDEKTLRIMQKAVRRFMVGRKPNGLLMEETFIRTPANERLRLCVYSTKNTTKNAVGLLWFHGGGYAIGVPEQDTGFIRQFLSTANCVVVAPDYTLSTEKPYPAALLDGYAALRWMGEHVNSLGIRADQLFVGGDSAGGGLTAAVTLMARDKAEVNVAFQMPLYPMIDDRMITPSARDNHAPVWDSHANELAWKMYLGDLFGSPDVPTYAAPARAKDYGGLQPTYSFVGSLEPFYDETVAYVAALRDAGVSAEIDVYEGCYHAFDVIAGKSPVGRAAREVLLARFAYAAAHCFKAQPETPSH